MATGKTNAGGGAKITGTLESLVVAAGKTVNKGDFVALKMAASVGSSVSIDTITAGDNLCASKYGNTLFVAYREVISSVYYVTVKAINVGTSTPATTATLRSATDVTYGYGNKIAVYAISETRCMLSFHGGSGTTRTFRLLEVSGSTLNVLASTTATVQNDAVLNTVPVASGKYALFYYYSSTTYVRIITYTDSSITVGAQYSVAAYSSSVVTVADRLEDDKLVFAYGSSASNVAICVLSVSGTVVTVGTSASLTLTSALGSATSVVALSSSIAAVLTNLGNILIFTVSGTTVTAPSYPHYVHVGTTGSRIVKLTSGKLAMSSTAQMIPCAAKACYVCDTAEYSIASLYPFAHTGNKLISLLMSASAISAIIATITETVEPAGTAHAIFGIAKTGGAAGETISVFVPA